MSEKIPFTLSSKTLSMIIDGKSEIIDRSALNYGPIVEALKKGDSETVRELVKVRTMIASMSKGQIYVNPDTREVMYNGEVVHNAIVDRMFEMLAEDFDITPMVNFLQNLLQNPSKTSIDELYLFLEATNLPITEDGHFLAYKMVRKDYLDIYTGTFDNSVGKKLSMPRGEVDPVRDRTCSHGFHFCSESYLGSGYSTVDEGRVVILKINPRDVVSIPSDYNNAKGRACEYTVVDELQDWSERLKAYVIRDPKPKHSEAPNDGIPDYMEDDEDDLWDSVRDYEDDNEDDEDDLWDSVRDYEQEVPNGTIVKESTLSQAGSLLGEDNPAAVLTEAKVRQIRQMYADNWTQTAIAEVIGVSRRTVGRVINGDTWSHIE